MQKNDALFELVQSLTKGEKRNFKLLTQLTSGDKKYIQLFDLTDKQKVYNEKKILKFFAGDPISNQLAVAKNYLYKLILKSLAYYYKEHDAELSTLCFQVKILIEKNLFQHASKLLRKAKSKAESAENFYELLQLLEFERIILTRTNDLKMFRGLIELIQEKEIQVSEKLENLRQYRHLADKAYIIRNTVHEVEKPRESELYSEVTQSPLMAGENMALSKRALLEYLNLRKLGFNFERKVRESLTVTRRMLDIFEDYAEIRLDNFEVYMEQLYDKARFHFILREDEEGFEALDQLQQLKTRGAKDEIVKYERWSLLKLARAVNMGESVLGMKVIQEIQEEREKLEAPVSKAQELMVYYFTAYLYFMAGYPREALKWNNKLLNEPRNEIREDLESIARIMNLFILLELDNYELLDYRIKNTYRFIFKRNRMNGFEKAVIGFVRKMTDNRGVLDNSGHLLTLTESLPGLIEKLNEMLYDPREVRSMNYLDVISWAESKLEGRTMADVIRTKYKRSLDVIRQKEKEGEKDYRFLEANGAKSRDVVK
ncbi:MAG: hypothetical protein H6581_00800 [Bacteroidia bacterium]|nr:hypothetical protein [Bacteroidia bacterium]